MNFNQNNIMIMTLFATVTFPVDPDRPLCNTGQDCLHVSVGLSDPWFAIDLHEEQNFTQVVIENRNHDSCKYPANDDVIFLIRVPI